MNKKVITDALKEKKNLIKITNHELGILSLIIIMWNNFSNQLIHFLFESIL